MGLFDLFKTKNTGLTEEQRKWNKMWELGEYEDGYMEYETEDSQEIAEEADVTEEV